MPASSDVIIAGAGIIGGTLAWRLLQAGCRVTLADAGVMGGEASRAGAGMLSPGSESAHDPAWTSLAVESRRLFTTFVAELAQESGTAIDYRVGGGLDLAAGEQEWAELSKRHARQKPLGIVSEPLQAPMLRKLVGELAVGSWVGGLFYPGDAQVDPRDLMESLRRACLARGARLLEATKIVEIKAQAGGVQARTEAGEPLAADVAVISAGAWSSQIRLLAEPPLELPESVPVKGHLVGFQLSAGSLGVSVRHGHTYMLQRNNGFTIAGSDEQRAGFDRAVDDNAAADIVRRARLLLPDLLAGEPTERWMGFRPATAAGMPEIRRLPGTKVWLAYGHYRNGILLAPVTARRLAAEIIAS